MTAARIFCCAVLLLVANIRVLPKADPVDSTEPTQAFDRYGSIHWKDEKARLDNFAIQLLQDSNYLGYIWVLQAAEMCPGEAEARAIRAKKYLTEYRHVPANRIVWMIGYWKEFETVFWVITRDKAASYPTVPDDESPHGRNVVAHGCTKRLARIRRSKFN